MPETPPPTATPQQSETKTPKQRPTLVAGVVEHGPLVAFVGTYLFSNLIIASAVFAATTVIAMIAARLLRLELPRLAMVSAAAVLFFGALTYLLDDERFIKIKPTVVCLSIAAWLLWCHWRNKAGLRALLGKSLQLDETGWRSFNFRWMLLFAFLAAVNEVVWRNFSNDVWVAFKFAGFPAIVLVFTLSQIGFLARHGKQ